MRRTATILLIILLVALTAATPAAADKPIASIPPGTWHGTAVVTGSIAGNGIAVTITSPSVYTFEFQIQPDGTVSNGLWSTNTANVNVNVPSLGPSTGTFSGGGSLGGTGDFITASGSYNITVSIPSLGVSGFPVDFPASGGFQATTVGCTIAYGDLATEARKEQKAAGFSTSVIAPFTATRIAAPGQQGVESWNETYVELIDKMEALSGKENPTANEVSQLVTQIENFQVNLNKAQSCPDLPSNFKKGKQPYTYFVEKYTEMLNKLLDNPAAYSGSDISEMLFAALQLGAVGSAAPDEQAADELEAKFLAVLGQKLNADIATGNKDDAQLIYMAASQAGYKDLAAEAHDFAFS